MIMEVAMFPRENSSIDIYSGKKFLILGKRTMLN